MQGRIENQLKVEKKLFEKLSYQPVIITDFYNGFGSKKSFTTKKVYIEHVVSFLNYLEENKGFNINCYEDYKSIDFNTINSYMEFIRYRNVDGVTRENKPGYRASKYYAINYFFNFLIKSKIIDCNPCDGIEIPETKEDIDVVSLDIGEIQMLQQNIMEGVGSNKARARQKEWQSRDMAIVLLGLSTGLRVTSMSEINIDDIDFTNNTIRVTEKGNKTRECEVGKSTMEYVLRWIEDRDKLLKIKDAECNALFISSGRTRITSKSLENLIEKYSYNIDKHITFHKLRSSCGTHLYENTGDIYLVQEVLGHKNISNTRRYTRLSKDRKREAANIMDNVLF